MLGELLLLAGGWNPLYDLEIFVHTLSPKRVLFGAPLRSVRPTEGERGGRNGLMGS